MSVESRDDIIHIPEGQDNLEGNRHAGYESIDELKCATGSDNNDPGSVEYHYIDDTNPPSDYQAIEEIQLETNDYEDISGTNPAYDYIQAINKPLTLTSKCMKAVLFLLPTFASVTLNIIAGFFTSLMFHYLVFQRNKSFEDGEIAAEAGTSFIVFPALAAASCGPLMIRFGFRKVALVGSVLLICSSLSSSVTTTADIPSFPFDIMGGFAVGQIRTVGVVAIVDHLYTRQTLALLVSHTCFTLGNVGSILGLRRYDWHIDRRLFGMIAVMGLIAGCCLQRTSQAQENVSMLFKHPPFYFLISITLAISVGTSILQAETVILDNAIFNFGSRLLVLSVLVIIFQKEKLKEASLFFPMGISVVALGLIALVHQDAFDSPQVVKASSSLLGAVIAFTQAMLPLALVNTTGRRNLKLSLPLLVCLDEIGRLIGGSIHANTSSSPVNAALYCAGVSLIISGVGAIIAAVVIKLWPSLSNQAEAEDRVEDRAQETGDRVEDQVEEAENHVEDRAQETGDRVEDQVEEAENHVEDRAQETGDRVEDRAQETGDRVEDRAQETGDRVEDRAQETGDRVEDQVEEAENHVEDRAQETGDRVEDQVEEAENHVEDRAQETGDRVEDQVEEAENHVEDRAQETGDRVEDQVEEAENHVEDRAQETGDRVEDRAQETGDRVEDRAQETGDRVEDRAQETGDRVEDQVEEAENHVEDRAQETGDRVEDQVEEAENHVEDRAQETGDRVEDQVEEAENHVEDRAQKAEDRVEDRVQEAEDRVEDHVEEAENHVEDRVQEAEHHVEDRAQKAEDRVEDQVEEAENHVEDRVQEAENHVEDRAQEVEDRVEDRAQEVEDRVEDQVEEAENHVEDRAQEAGDRVEDQVEEAENHVEDRAQEAGDRVEDQVEEAENHVEDRAQEAVDRVEDRAQEAVEHVDEAETPL